MFNLLKRALWNVYLQKPNNFSCFFIQKGFDVFNALDLMENKTFLEKLKFGIGDGNLQYYLYNWKCPSMGPEKVRFWNDLFLLTDFILGFLPF